MFILVVAGRTFVHVLGVVIVIVIVFVVAVLVVGGGVRCVC